MSLHTWWINFGSEVSDVADLSSGLAKDLATLAFAGTLPGVTLTGMRQSSDLGYTVVALDVDVERPQDLAYPITAAEPVAIGFPFDGGQPTILSLRPDFPDTPHQNWAPPGGPYALCVDDRPWDEAKLTASARDIVRRVQLWLAKAAKGELHDPAQPPDPLFFASQLSLILPAAALAQAPEPVELAGMVRGDNENLIISRPADPSNPNPAAFTVLAFTAKPQAMARLRHAPDTLALLAAELEPYGIHFIDELKTRLKTWHGLDVNHVRRLATRLAIVVAFPADLERQPGVNDIRAFLTFDTVGAIGVALGVLLASETGIGDKRGYMLALTDGEVHAERLKIEPAQVHFALDRNLAATIAGRTPDRRKAVLIGAGSLGSQLSVDLAREGAFAWTVVDDDFLLPHNFVRHALFGQDVGAPKAQVLASRLSSLLGEPTLGLRSNIVRPDEGTRPQLDAALSER